MSGRTGGADVLEALGVGIDLTPENAGRSLDLLGITFLFAPNYHTALRHASSPRREIGVRTVFNVLGPLTNPAGATRQLLGVFHHSPLPPVAELLQHRAGARVVHAATASMSYLSQRHARREPRRQAVSSKSTPRAGAAHTDVWGGRR
jgi:anthranilate phosphoribosyltransferase